MSITLMFNTVFYCLVGIKNNLSTSIKCDSGLENLSSVKCRLYINKLKYISKRAKYWCQEQSEMTITKYLLITFLKNSCSNHVKKLNEKTWWGHPYSVKFSSYSSKGFQLYLKTAKDRCLWLFEFKNWLTSPTVPTGFNFFNHKN